MKHIVATLTASTVLFMVVSNQPIMNVLANDTNTTIFELSSYIENEFSLKHEKLEVDKSLFDKFLKYSLLVTDKDSLTAEELELCYKIFETERTYMPYITCQYGRETIKNKTLAPRVTTENEKLLACMAPNYVGAVEIYDYYPDIAYNPFDYNYSEKYEFWCGSSGTERIISDYDLNNGPAYEIKFTEQPDWNRLDELTELCWSGGNLTEIDGAYLYSGEIDGARYKDLLYYQTCTSDIWTYILLEDDSAFIIDCTLPKYNKAERIEEPLTLPTEIDGHVVSGIQRALSGTGVSKFIVPETYKNVRFLTDMKYLEEVEVNAPDLTLKSFLSNCPNLRFAVLNVKSIEDNVFFNCDNLETVEIKGADGILYSAFSELPSLSNVTLSEGIRYIGQDAFIDTAVTELIIPSSVEIVGALKNPYIYNGEIIDTLTANSIKIADDDCVIKAYYDSEAYFYAIANNCRFSPLDNIQRGDVNDDGEFNIADVVVLQKWILGCPDIELKSWKNGDFCADGVLNVFDICLMKREILKNSD